MSAGMVIAKMRGQQLPTLEHIENALNYAESFSIAYNKKGIIYIIKNIEDIDQYKQILEKNEINKKCGMLYKFKKFESYYTNKQFDYDYPLAITDSYEDMLCEQTDKSVIAFHEQIIGLEDEQVSKTKQFCKYLSHFDRINHYQIFKLSVGDNLVAILNNDGSIQLYGNEKRKKWQNVGKIYFSDNDYRYKTTVSTYNQYYQNNYYNDYYNDDYYSNYYNDEYDDIYRGNKTQKKSNSVGQLICDQCFKPCTCLTLVNGHMVCSDCINKSK